MAAPSCTEEQFIAIWNKLGGAAAVAKELKIHERCVHQRRRGIEARTGIKLEAKSQQRHYALTDHPAIKNLSIDTGTVLIGSDAHYWKGMVSTAHKAFVRFCTDLKPSAVILNGDVLDGATISRHPPIGWEGRPSLIQELEACKDRLEEIEKASPKGASFIWTLGNHDSRFETRLASTVPEYAKIHGFHLKDHFPRWMPAWAAWINEDVVVKHRYKGGIHAPHNNTINSGKTMVTGHLHSLKVSPFSDYNGTRFGCDCGTLADPYGPQFSDYTEVSPVAWRSGFIVLTFKDGRLLWPEVVHVIEEGLVEFRGQIIKV
jgi:predicted phosphodiesterase